MCRAALFLIIAPVSGSIIYYIIRYAEKESIRMKKKLLALFLATLMVLSLAACGGGDSGAKTDSGDSKPSGDGQPSGDVECTTIKFNFSKSTTDATYALWSEVLDRVYEESGHTVKFEIFPSEALGSIPDTIESASKGELVMADGDLAYLETYVPDLSVGMAPYLMQKPEDIQKFWESEIGEKLFGQLEEKGIKCISMSYFGTRNTMTNSPVHSRADFGKLKIRCASAAMWNEVVRVLGGNATNTAWSEVYQAISQGVADGCESPLSALYSSKVQEVCKYCIETEHCIASTVLVMSNEVFNNLPQQAQDAITKVMHEYCDEAIQNVNTATEEIRQKMIDEGVEFIQVDKTDFIAAAQDTPNYFNWTPGLYDEVKAALGY